jgi:hypothetical protein
MRQFTNLHARANAVLAELKKLAKNDGARFYVEPYKNGRERGWAVERADPFVDLKVAFSEGRSTDDLVVYRGRGRDFDAAGNIPSEEVYEDGSYHSTPEKAALVAWSYLRGEVAR